MGVHLLLSFSNGLSLIWSPVVILLGCSLDLSLVLVGAIPLLYQENMFKYALKGRLERDISF